MQSVRFKTEKPNRNWKNRTNPPFFLKLYNFEFCKNEGNKISFEAHAFHEVILTKCKYGITKCNITLAIVHKWILYITVGNFFVVIPV